MADPKNMSVEEILATCRRLDGGGGGAAPEPPKEETPPSEAAAEAPAAAESAPAPATPPPAGKDPKQMSVAEMLAAARAEKSAGAAAKASSEETPAAKTAGGAAAKPAAGKSAKEMSVAEMLAAARAEKSAPKPAAAAKPAAKKPAAKTAAKPAAAKASPKPAAKAPSGPKDTTSILAAARAAKAKPGPISKAEAAARGEAAKGKPAKAKLPAPPMPEKPAYARAAPSPPREEASDRRGFFSAMFSLAIGSSLAVGFTSLAVTNLLWLLGLARFMFPNILTEPPTKFKVGFPDEYAPGQVQTKYKAQFGVWIVRYEYDGNPEIYALQSVCTHLGCTPNWLEGEQKFKCPCHGSGFYKDGINFEGPAPRPLERFAIKVADDGQLEVDKSQKFLEEKGEWSDPASYVQV